MERETKIIETPVGEQEVELKAWLTGRETRELKKILQEGMEFSMEGRGGDTKVKNDKMAELMEKAEDKAIQTVVVSIDDDKEEVLESILDMRSQDYDFVVEEINKVTGGDDFTKSE